MQLPSLNRRGSKKHLGDMDEKSNLIVTKCIALEKGYTVYKSMFFIPRCIWCRHTLPLKGHYRSDVNL